MSEMKLMRPLDPAEIRVLGSLMEKQQATPDYYPMTVNSLVAACNQKTNRDPVMELSEEDVTAALERLQQQVLVWKVLGGRTIHWKHNVDGPWQLDARQKAILTLLLLRGPQTTGELRGRAERLHPFASVSEVEDVLASLRGGDEPLVTEMGRQPGQKETRWMHLVSGTPAEDATAEAPATTARAGPTLAERVSRLEEEFEALREEMRQLRRALGEP